MAGVDSVLESLGSERGGRFGGIQVDVEAFAGLAEKEQELMQKKG